MFTSVLLGNGFSLLSLKQLSQFWLQSLLLFNMLITQFYFSTNLQNHSFWSLSCPNYISLLHICFFLHSLKICFRFTFPLASASMLFFSHLHFHAFSKPGNPSNLSGSAFLDAVYVASIISKKKEKKYFIKAYCTCLRHFMLQYIDFT